jgi:hypothetical protein
MKLSDKALRQIGRKLLDRTAGTLPLNNMAVPLKRAANKGRTHPQWLARKQRKAAVLTFKKRGR